MVSDLIKEYNYEIFARQFFEKWMRWEASPVIGTEAPDFPLWTLDEKETSLNATWSQYKFLIVEFGSFT